MNLIELDFFNDDTLNLLNDINSNLKLFDIIQSNLFIAKNGNIGIGTTEPSSKLDIITNSSSTNNLLNFKNESNIGIYVESTGILNKGNTLDFKVKNNNSIIKNLLTLRPEGNIGIGTTNPEHLLHLKGGDITSGGVQLKIENESYNKGIQFNYTSDTSGTYDFVQAKIYTSGSSYNSDLHFATADGSSDYNHDDMYPNSTLSTNMTIQYNGNVGIGTTISQEKLDIKDGNIILSGSYNAYTYIGDTNWGTGVVNSGSTYYNEIKGSWNDGNNRGFRLFNSFNNTIPFFVNSNGNVGIGITNPIYKIDMGTTAGGAFTAANKGVISLYDNNGTYFYGFSLCGPSGSEGVGIWGGTEGSAPTDANCGLFVRRNNQNVGIGITNPSGRLHIYESSGTVASSYYGSIILQHGNSGGASSIVFKSAVNHGSDYGYIQYQDSSSIGAGGESAKLIIGTQNDADDDIILMPKGSVGIGTMSPAEKLEVNGWIGRSAHNNGGLCGSYQTSGLGSNDTKTNPIYVIGSDYKPNENDLNDMYGIGYSHTNTSFINSDSGGGWGMYVAADGDARIFLNGGTGKKSCSDVVMPNLGSVYNRIYSIDSSAVKRSTFTQWRGAGSYYADHGRVLYSSHRPPSGKRRIGHWTITVIGSNGTTSLYNNGGTIMFTSGSWANVIGGVPWAWTYGSNGDIYHNSWSVMPSGGGTLRIETWYIDMDI